MAKLTHWLRNQPIKTALLRVILVGTLVSGLSILVYLLLWNALISLLAPYVTPTWLIAVTILFVTGAIGGSLALLIAVMTGAARLFYRIKLADPLQQLQFGVTHIQAQDLDFHLTATAPDELGALVAAFEKMRQALQDALQTAWRLADDQKQVNAAFAHDLRTPLTVLQGNVELLTLENQEAQPLNPDIIKDMQQQLDRINHFIQTMTHVAAIHDIALSPTPTSTQELIRTLKDEAQKLAGTVPFTWAEKLAAAPNHLLAIAPAAILEVFDNQLTNAFRFARTTVGITVTVTEKTVQLAVFNDGQPLTPEEQANAQLPFFSSGKAANHLGVGMYICRTLCTAHHGRFSVANVDHGVTSTALFAYF